MVTTIFVSPEAFDALSGADTGALLVGEVRARLGGEVPHAVWSALWFVDGDELCASGRTTFLLADADEADEGEESFAGV